MKSLNRPKRYGLNNFPGWWTNTFSLLSKSTLYFKLKFARGIFLFLTYKGRRGALNAEVVEYKLVPRRKRLSFRATAVAKLQVIFTPLSLLTCFVYLFLNYVAPTNCEHQRADSVAKPTPGAFTPRCKSDGNFESVQCHGSVCYCVNNKGIALPSTEVSIGQGRPNCQDPG